MTPRYKPVDPAAPYSGKQPYYHTSGESWLADVEYPNPSAQIPVANPAKRQRRQPKRKAVVRLGKMRKPEKRLVLWLILALLGKWLIFGL